MPFPVPPENLALSASSHSGEMLTAILFPDAAGAATEAAALAGLTIGDIVYPAASIDPHVVMAADFSRLQDLRSIFSNT